MFANKINRQTAITLECVEEQISIHLQFNKRLTSAPES